MTIVTRYILITIGVLLVLTLSSPVADAQLFKLFGKKEPSIPTVFNRMPTQTELLQHLAKRGAAFRQLSSNVVISLDGAPKLRGSMQLELPMRLRVKANVLGVSGVDVGSNENDFWVFTKVNLPNQKPAIFHASHEGFRSANSRIRK
ncbi:MAG: hypothetical protein AAGA30_15565, partial [Planctomycetota bacterium]